ncbi:MFS transporter [Leucobacter sp. UCMA 4100]|uniref:MFS transporter n=1 Tax=Leucobacter sp. UCMA 4100 TaxID=2810534 RepID=UPI0022EAB9DA|nr:MFS transporter [Leucobacter sp. UCMA 4100]MDA3145948.1 MFS transporter [Leucobacter sp. UCMA 4100]
MATTAKKKLPFEVWALIAGAFTIALGYGVVAPVLPQFAQEFGVSSFAATAVISSFALSRLIFAPVAGGIVTKLGERTTYVTGLLIVATMTGAAVFVGEYWQLLLSRGLAGIGSSMFSIASTALMIKVMPAAQRGQVAGMNSAAFLLGNLLGPVLGALVAGWGLRAPFIVYFFTLLAAALVVGIALRRSTNIGVAAGEHLLPPQTFREAFRVRQYRGALLSTFSFGWAIFGVRISAVPLFVAGALGGGGRESGWVLAAYAAGNAVFVIPSGRWNDKIGRKPLLVTGFALSTIAFIVFPLTTSIPLAMATLALAGVAAACANPAQQAVIADVVGKRGGGQVVAAGQMSADLGGILGPLIAGILIDTVSYQAAFWLTAVLLGITTVVWIFTPDSRVLNDADITAEATIVSPTEPETGPITLPLEDELPGEKPVTDDDPEPR